MDSKVKIYVTAEKTTSSMLVGYALSDIGLSAAADKIIIRENENSKPFLKNGGAFFNISHSGGITACAVSLEREVGLDVEFDRTLRSFAAAKKIFTKEELTVFLTLSDKEKSAALLKRWTLFECFFKLNGNGLKALFSFPPAAFDEPSPNVFSRADFVYGARPALIYYHFFSGAHISCAVDRESEIEVIKV